MNYEKIAERIRESEGLCFLPYKCPTGHLTIGYGHNLEHGISKEVAEQMLREDIEQAIKQVKKNFVWWPKLTDARIFVLIDLVFNMGISKLLTFKKMLSALEAGKYETAAKELLNSRYAQQVGHRAKENATMLKFGEWI